MGASYACSPIPTIEILQSKSYCQSLSFVSLRSLRSKFKVNHSRSEHFQKNNLRRIMNRVQSFSILGLVGLSLSIFLMGDVLAQKKSSSKSKPGDPFDKIFKIDTQVKGKPITFDQLSQILARSTRSKKLAPKSKKKAISFTYFKKDGIVRWEPTGKAGIAIGRAYRAPIAEDRGKVKKSLSISGQHPQLKAKGTRHVKFSLSLQVSKGYGERKRKVKKLAEEDISFCIVENPKTEKLHLICDEGNFFKNLKKVSTNKVLSESQETGALDSEKFLEEEEEEEGSVKKTEGKTEVVKSKPKRIKGEEKIHFTRIKSFTLKSSKIEIIFQRPWERADNHWVEGTLEVRLNPTLDTTLYYAPLKKDGKPGKKLKAAYFIKGTPSK